MGAESSKATPTSSSATTKKYAVSKSEDSARSEARESSPAGAGADRRSASATAPTVAPVVGAPAKVGSGAALPHSKCEV